MAPGGLETAERCNARTCKEGGCGQSGLQFAAEIAGGETFIRGGLEQGLGQSIEELGGVREEGPFGFRGGGSRSMLEFANTPSWISGRRCQRDLLRDPWEFGILEAAGHSSPLKVTDGTGQSGHDDLTDCAPCDASTFCDVVPGQSNGCKKWCLRRSGIRESLPLAEQSSSRPRVFEKILQGLPWRARIIWSLGDSPANPCGVSTCLVHCGRGEVGKPMLLLELAHVWRERRFRLSTGFQQKTQPVEIAGDKGMNLEQNGRFTSPHIFDSPQIPEWLFGIKGLQEQGCEFLQAQLRFRI